MVAGDIWEVQPADGSGWIVRRAGAPESESTLHSSIEEAIEHARKLARDERGEARVKDRGGRIAERWTFGDFGYPI